MTSNDRALADEIVSVIRTNTSTAGAPWYANPAAAQAGEIRAALDEHFATPRTVAGQARAALDVLQEANLTALQNELSRPDAGDRVPMLLANGVFQWLLSPDPNQDAADRFAEITRLAAGPAGMPFLSADGSRLIANEAEALGPVQYGGLDRGAHST